MVSVVGMLSLGLSIAVATSPVIPIVVAVGLIYVILLWSNPAWIVHGLILVCFITTPAEIPGGFGFAGYYVYFYEFFLIGSAIYAITLARKTAVDRPKISRSIGIRATAIFVAAFAFAGAIGFSKGYSLQDINADTRPIFNMLVGIFVITTVIAVGDGLRYIKTITAVLVISAFIMIFASVAGVPLAGREETAQLYTTTGGLVSGGSDALRYLTSTTPLALAALLFTVALVALKRARLATVAPVLLSSLVISFLGFSRNTLLALAGTIAFIVLLAFVHGWLMATVGRLLETAAMSALLLGLVVLGSNAVGGGAWIESQISGYTNRVFAGLNQSTAAVDTSTQDRLLEDRYIVRAGEGHELTGNGLGTRYKPAMGPSTEFAADKGELYAHNFYGWLYVKGGVLGVSAFVAMILGGILPALRRRYRSQALGAASATLFGLAVTLIVMPLPLDHGNSLLLAMVMSVCFGLTIAVGTRSAASADSDEPVGAAGYDPPVEAETAEVEDGESGSGKSGSTATANEERS